MKYLKEFKLYESNEHIKYNLKKFKSSLDWGYFPEPNKPIISQHYFNEACMEQGIKSPKEIKGYTFI